jgi:thiol-disulfide isomerase/thioredoxin
MNKNIMRIIVIGLVITAIIWLQKPAPGEVERVMPSIKKNGIVAPEMQGIAGYINTRPVLLKDLVGKKVVLVDFWTYSCINCQRTLPHVTAWHKKYKDKGLEIIGVHSPEFDFEKKRENVERAVKNFGIKYPVVLDNEHGTWNAWQNRYWPAKYLIDIDGYVAYHHFGEGAYEETERKIQELLAERAERLGMTESITKEMVEMGAEEPSFERIKTPEIYLGPVFTRGNFGNEQGLPAGKTVNYSLPDNFRLNQVYLEGKWFVDKDHVRLVSDTGRVVLKYDARNVNIVAGSEAGSGIKTFVDEKETSGWCSPDGTCNNHVKAEDLYPIINGSSYGQRTLTIEVNGAGFRLYTFTFG